VFRRRIAVIDLGSGSVVGQFVFFRIDDDRAIDLLPAAPATL